MKCADCAIAGRMQAAHHIVDRDGKSVGLCRWHYKGLPYPTGKSGSPELETPAIRSHALPRLPEPVRADLLPEPTAPAAAECTEQAENGPRSGQKENVMADRRRKVDGTEIVAAWKGGMTEGQIRQKFGISSPTICWHLKRAGINRREARLKEAGRAVRAVRQARGSLPRLNVAQVAREAASRFKRGHDLASGGATRLRRPAGAAVRHAGTPPGLQEELEALLDRAWQRMSVQAKLDALMGAKS